MTPDSRSYFVVYGVNTTCMQLQMARIRQSTADDSSAIIRCILAIYDRIQLVLRQYTTKVGAQVMNHINGRIFSTQKT